MGQGRIEYLERRLDMTMGQLQQEIERQEKFGDGDDWEDNTVLSWSQRYNGSGIAYTFVAIKIGGRWYTTSQFNNKLTYEDLVFKHLMHAVDGEIWVVSGWERF